MKIICLNGPPGAGKDTAASFIKHRGWVELKMSEPLKAGCAAIFGVDREVVEQIKEIPHHKLFDMSWREAQIWLSEEVMKSKFGEDVFGQLMVKRIEDGEVELGYVISDLGFPIEYDVLEKRFGAENIMLVHIKREGHTFENDSRDWVRPEGKSPYIIVNDMSFHTFSNRFHSAVKHWLNTR